MKVNLSGVSITDKERQYVMNVLNSGILSMGEYTERFENLMAQYSNRKYAVAVSSGTAGLFLLLKYFGVDRRSDIITSPFSFVASSNVIIHAGANAVFCDIDRNTLTLSPDLLRQKIQSEYKQENGKMINRDTGNELRGIIPVDIFGLMPDYDDILQLAEEYNIFVIEDSCEALGSSYRNRMAGSFGQGGVFAFYANKQITTGEGGMILTDDEHMYGYLRAMRNQGRMDMDLWLEHSLLGYNFRIDEMSSALGCAQMERIEYILRKRADAAAYYEEILHANDNIKTALRNIYGETGWFVYVIQVDADIRNDLMEHLLKRGIGVRPYFTPIHLQPCYQGKKGDFPITEGIAGRTVAIPFHTEISRKEQDFVKSSMEDFFNAGK